MKPRRSDDAFRLNSFAEFGMGLQKKSKSFRHGGEQAKWDEIRFRQYMYRSVPIISPEGHFQ